MKWKWSKYWQLWRWSKWLQSMKIIKMVTKYEDYQNGDKVWRWSKWLQIMKMIKRVTHYENDPNGDKVWRWSIWLQIMKMIKMATYYENDQNGYNFPIRTTPKKIPLSELGVIFCGSPLFLAVFGHVLGATTLNFGPISTKLGGIVWAIKKWPRRTTDMVRAGIAEKRAFLRSAEKWFLA